MRFFVAARERAIQRISEEINEEEARVTECSEAIGDISLAIDEGKRTLKAQVETLTNLMAIQSRAIDHEQTKIPQRDRGTRSGALERLRTRIAGPISGGFTTLDDQISAQKKEVADMEHNIRELEVELDRWSYLHELSSRAVAYLNDLRLKEEESLEQGKSDSVPRRILALPPEKRSTHALSAINKVSPNVWLKIFKLTAEEEYRAYIGNAENTAMPDYPSLRPLAYVLSHVCQSWRNVVHSSPLLWDLVYIPPSPYWRKADSELLNASLQKSQEPLSLITNLFHTPSNHHLVIKPEEVTIFDGRSYTLHIHMRDDNPEDVQKLSSIPLHNAKAVIISSSGPLAHKLLWYKVHEQGSKMATSLTLINDYPTFLESANMLVIFPALTSLRFCFKEFPQAFPISGYLAPNLEELYIHAALKPRVRPLSNVSLTKLHTLKICSNDLSFLYGTSIISLKRLILYGSQDAEEINNSMSSGIAKQIYERLECVEFEDWGVGAVSFIARIASSWKLTLRSITFSRSYVDGDELVKIIEDATRRYQLPLLEVLKLNETSGITRIHCERIRPLLKKMEIYV